MTGEITTTGFSDVAEKLREKIKSAFVELIPENQWDTMLKTEVNRFMKDRDKFDQYDRMVGSRPSEFSEICQKHLSEFIHAEIKARFEATDKTALREDIARWINENSDRVLRNFITELFRSVAGGLISNLKVNLDVYLRNFFQSR